MSRHLHSRKYWEEYPKEQGIASICIALACVVFSSIVNFFISEHFFNEAYVLLISAFLFWGIACFIVGIIREKMKNKKNHSL